jgi:hypothetical protein
MMQTMKIAEQLFIFVHTNLFLPKAIAIRMLNVNCKVKTPGESLDLILDIYTIQEAVYYLPAK